MSSRFVTYTIFMNKKNYDLLSPNGNRNFFNRTKWKPDRRYSFWERTFKPENLPMLIRVKNQINAKYPDRIVPGKGTIRLPGEIAYRIPRIRKNLAAKKILTAWRESRSRVNSPSKQRLNNPAWFRRVIRNLAATRRREAKKSRQVPSSPPLPNIPRTWGKWFGPYNNEYISENGRWKYYKNSNRLVNTANNKTYNNARKRFGIPF